MLAFRNLSVGLFKINMPFFEGGSASGCQGADKNTKEKNKRRSDNMTRLTGFYKGVLYINGVPQFPKEKRKEMGLPERGILTSKDMNERDQE